MVAQSGDHLTTTTTAPGPRTLLHSMLSFVNGMSEFLEGEVSLVCRKIILIHGRNPGFYYLDLKRFK